MAQIMQHQTRDLLSADDVAQIHQTSMRLLAEVGIEFPHEGALATFKRRGVRVAGNRVHLDEDQIADCLATVPRRFTIHARDPDRDLTIGNGRPAFAPGYGAPFLVDAGVGKRHASIEDYRRLVKLVHALPNQDLSGHLLVQPSDLPAGAAHLHMLLAHMVHSDKSFIGSSDGVRGAGDTMAMSSILFDRDVRGWPVALALVDSLTPLAYATRTIDAILVYAQWRQPIMVVAMVMAGLTGPITLAGVLALQNAEILAGIALAQLVSPGTPVVYGATSSGVDLRTGALAIGGPELSLLVAGHAQLARFYELPSRGGGSLTDANSPDAQAGYESMLSLLTTLNHNIDLVLHAAGILSSFMAVSYEKFVLDDEMCGMVRRIQRGITVDSDTLAYNTIARVGPRGNYLTQPDTVARCRTEFWTPSLADRGGADAWMAGGRRDASSRAQQRCEQLLAEHHDPPMDAVTTRQLLAYVKENATGDRRW